VKRYLLFLSIVLLIAASFSSVNAVERTMREVPNWVDEGNNTQSFDNQTDTIRYDNSPWSWFLTIPNDYGDKYYNVRFKPRRSPFGIQEAVFAFFDMRARGDSIPKMGKPNMRIIVWEDGIVEHVSGLPTTPIDSMVVPFEDMVFGNTPPRFFGVDMSELRITFQDTSEFHIGIDLVPREGITSDTLALYYDNATRETDRSSVFTGDEEKFFKLQSLFNERRGFNFAIRAVLADTLGVYTLDPYIPPDVMLLYPSYPNPFNEATTIHFYAAPGLKYNAELFDIAGKRVMDVGSGVGAGEGRFDLKASRLTDGVYFLRMNSPVSTSTQRLIYLK
jgi:hypothetical protein